MALTLVDLNQQVRDLMSKEIQSDYASERIYFSRRLSDSGRKEYVDLLTEAIVDHDDEWLANELRQAGRLNTLETRSGEIKARKVPSDAPNMIAEGEFNYYYMRALCKYAQENNIAQVRVYRAKAVQNPRPESQEKIGAMLSARSLYDDLVVNHGSGGNFDTILGLPPGPNSGLSIQLP